MATVDHYTVGLGLAMVVVSLVWLRGLAWLAIATDILLAWQLYGSIADPGSFQRTRPAWALLIVGAAIMIIASRWALLQPHRSFRDLVRGRFRESRKLRSLES